MITRKSKTVPTPKSGDFLRTETIDWGDFAALPDNPMQRDTVAHARIVREYMLQWKDRLAEVAAFEMPNGNGKLDGHTRVYLWQADQDVELPPGPLRCNWYFVDDLEAAGRLLFTYDNRRAAHQSSDELFGVMRHVDVEFQSQILKDRRFGGGLKIAQAYIDPSVRDTLVMVKLWLRELRLFDTVMPTHGIYTVAFMAGALLLLRRYGDAALPFLNAFQGNQGDQQGATLNAQRAFNDRAKDLRLEAAKKFSSARNGEIARLMVAGYNAVEQDRWFDANRSSGNGLRLMREAQFQAWLRECRERSGSGLVR